MGELTHRIKFVCVGKVGKLTRGTGDTGDGDG